MSLLPFFKYNYVKLTEYKTEYLSSLCPPPPYLLLKIHAVFQLPCYQVIPWRYQRPQNNCILTGV